MQSKLHEFMEDLNTKDLSKLASWFHKDSKVWVPPAGAVTGDTRILALFRAIFRKYHSLNWKVTEVHPVDKNRCIYFSESWGVMNDKPYSNQIVTEIIFNDEGQISFLSDYFKDNSLF